MHTHNSSFMHEVPYAWHLVIATPVIVGDLFTSKQSSGNALLGVPHVAIP